MVLILIYIKIKFENANDLVSKKYDIASRMLAIKNLGNSQHVVNALFAVPLIPPQRENH